MAEASSDLGRGSFADLTSVVSPKSVTPPPRTWSDSESTKIREGHRARNMDDHWCAFVEQDRLFLHRSWTGIGIYEVQFEPVPGGWRVREAVVAGDSGGRLVGCGPDSYDTLLLEQLVDSIFLGLSLDVERLLALRDT